MKYIKHSRQTFNSASMITYFIRRFLL